MSNNLDGDNCDSLLTPFMGEFFSVQVSICLDTFVLHRYHGLPSSIPGEQVKYHSELPVSWRIIVRTTKISPSVRFSFKYKMSA